MNTMRNEPIIYWASEALKPQPEISSIVNNIISEASLSVLFGDPGSMKTYSMLDMSICVASGKPWLSFSTKQVPVLYLDEETGLRRLSKRIQMVMRSYGAGEDLEFAYVVMEGFDLRMEEDRRKLLDLVIKTGAKLVIMDALADFMPGDENAVKDMLPCLRFLRYIANITGAAFVIIHHSGKSGRYRGSSSIKGAIDLMLKIQSKSDSPNIDFSSEKARDVEPFSFAAVANFGKDTFCLTPSIKTDKKQTLNKIEEKVLRIIRDLGEAKVNAIKEITSEYTRDNIRKAVNSLVGLNLIERIDGGGKGSEATYSTVSFNIEDFFDELENLG